MSEYGEKFINKKLINFDNEKIENLEIYAANIAEEENILKKDLDELISQLVSD